MPRPRRWASRPNKKYKLIIQAPASARKLPSGGLVPALTAPVSPKAIKTPPANATAIPRLVSFVGFSFNQSQESRATQTGLVVTRVVEAAIEVKESEVIQQAKCTARQIPAAPA